MSTEVQAIISAVRGLNAQQRQELAEELALLDDSRNRRQLIQSIQGKYKHISTSSEAFSQRKSEEIELESRL